MENQPRLPISEQHLILFIAHLHKMGMQASSICSIVSAIGHIHKMAGLNDVTKTFVVLKLLNGVKNRSRPCLLRLPITLSLLGRLVQAIPQVVKGRYDQVMIRAAFTLAFHAFLRVGEIVPKSRKDLNRVVQLSDIHWQNGKKRALLTLYKFKNSRKQGAQTIMLRGAAKSRSSPCAVKALRKFCSMRGTKPGPLFMIRQEPLWRRQFDKHLAAVVKFCGFSPAVFKGHSFRIGAATEAAAQGFSDSQIRNLGRWQSDAFKKYVRLSNIQAK